MEQAAVRKRFFKTDQCSGISLFLMGDVERDGKKCLLMRAESIEGHLFDFYYPGGIVEILPGAWKMYGEDRIKTMYEDLRFGLDAKREMIRCIDAVQWSKNLLLTPRKKNMPWMLASLVDMDDKPGAVKATNMVHSYTSHYDGDMHELLILSKTAHVSISNMRDFGNGDVALLHAEDGQGAYRDLLFPSLQMVEEQGTSEEIERLVRYVSLSRDAVSELLCLYASIYYGREWYTLYTKPEFTAKHSVICHDEQGEHVYVYVDIKDWLLKNSPFAVRRFVLRLPEAEIVEVLDIEKNVSFDDEAWKQWEIGYCVQIIAEHAKAIFALAKMVQEGGDLRELNAMRNTFHGAILRSLVSRCPHCGSDFEKQSGESAAIFFANLPVSFSIRNGEININKRNLEREIFDAVCEGRVTGFCEWCKTILTAERINAEKEGWQYLCD